MEEAEFGELLSLRGVETLFAAALRVCARHLATAPRPLPPLAMPVYQALLRAGLREGTVTDGNIDLFLPSPWLDLSDANHLSDAAVLRVASVCGPALTTLHAYKSSSFSPEAMCHLLSKAHGLQELMLSRAGCINDEVVRVVARTCTELRFLDLTKQSTLSAASLASLASLRQLQRLSLYACGAVNDDVLVQLSAITSLRHLSLARCTCVTDRGVCAIMGSNPHLAELIVSYCRNITDVTLAGASRLPLTFIDLTSLTALSEDALCAFFESRGAELHTVYLSFCAGVTPRVAATIAAHCALLEKIYLSRQPVLGDADIVAIARGCRFIQVLNVSNGMRLTDRALVCVAESLPDLHTLYLSGNIELSVDAVRAFATSYSRDSSLCLSRGFQLESATCVRFITPASLAIMANCEWGACLTAIDFTACSALTDDAMAPLAEHCVNVLWMSVSRTGFSDRGVRICANPRKRGLKRLDLLNLTETAITEHSLVALLSCFPRLTKLYLAQCNGLGAADDVLLQHRARSARLEALFLSYTASLTDEAFLLLVGQGRTLSCIMATRCLSLTDRSLARLPLCCPALTLVDLSSCAITDETLFSLARHSKFLGALVASQCVGIGSPGVIAVLQHNALLRSLCLSYCSNVDDEILPFIPVTLRSIALSRTRCTDEAVARTSAMLPATAFSYRMHRGPNSKQQRKEQKRAARRDAKARAANEGDGT